MRIALIGHGWIAGKMLHALRDHEVVNLTHENAFNYLRGIIPRRPIDWIVNCAGKTGSPNVDECETSKAETILANTVFPIQLERIAQQFGNRLMHFSSGCIFQGGPHSECDIPNFDGSVYSASKFASDEALRTSSVVLRIRMPFDNTERPKNLLTKLRHYAARGKVLDGLNSLSDADEMCEHAVQLLMDDAKNGVYHMVNQGSIWTHEIMDMMGIRCRWWDKDEFREKFPAVRSECQLTSVLPTLPVREALGNAIEKIRVAA